MANVVDLKCPECGARISAPLGQDVAQCEYCGKRIQVQRREGIFERPVKRVELPPQVRAQVQNLPVAVQRHTKRFLVVMLVLTIGLPTALAGVAFYFSKKQRDRVQRNIARAQQEASQRHAWAAHSNAPLIVDVNGDKAVDIVGRLRYRVPDPALVLVAIDGKTGARLWETPRFFNKDLSQSYLGITGATMLLADSLGVLHGYKLGDGTKLWKTPLGERVERMCAGSAATVLVQLKDKRWRQVGLERGGVKEVEEPPDSCAWMPTDVRNQPPPGIRVADHDASSGGKRINSLPGMYVSKVWERSRDGVLFALGHRSPGTHVPMIARFEMNTELPTDRPKRPDRRKLSRKAYWDALHEYSRANRAWHQKLRDARGKLLWKVDVPGVHALEVQSMSIEHAGVADSVIVVPYNLRGSHQRIAAFAIADGKRLWDVEVPKKAHGGGGINHVGVSVSHVYLTVYDRLHAFHLADGKLAFTVGED